MTDIRFKVYIHAYTVRLRHGEKLEDIDKEYLERKRLTETEIELVHEKLFR